MVFAKDMPSVGLIEFIEIYKTTAYLSFPIYLVSNTTISLPFTKIQIGTEKSSLN